MHGGQHGTVYSQCATDSGTSLGFQICLMMEQAKHISRFLCGSDSDLEHVISLDSWQTRYKDKMCD